MTGNIASQFIFDTHTLTRSRITIREVAARAGVSHQTVSRVINGQERVNPETRKKVESVIAELDYRPNAIARNMAQGRTRTLACIAPNLTDYTFASIIEGAERQAYSQGYFLFSATATDPQAFGTLVDELIASRRADGLMVINPYADERYKYMPQSAPVVFIGAYPRHEQVSAVALDDHVAGYVATQHLVMLGHRCIMHITGPLSEDCSRERYQGYQQAMSEACIPAVCDLVVEGDWSATSGYEAVKRILGQGGQFSALIAQNDRMAIGALRALREASLAVPRDISVIGFDDMPLASYFDPPLTTMRQDTHQIGQQAARLLIRSIEEPDTPRQFLRLDAELVLRATTCSLL